MQNGERQRDGRTQITMKNRRNNMTKNVSVYIKRERDEEEDTKKQWDRQRALR